MAEGGGCIVGEVRKKIYFLPLLPLPILYLSFFADKKVKWAPLQTYIYIYFFSSSFNRNFLSLLRFFFIIFRFLENEKGKKKIKFFRKIEKINIHFLESQSISSHKTKS